MSYPLYYTLNKNLKKTDLTEDQRDRLLTTFSGSLSDEETRKAVIMLIVEHAKAADNIPIDIENFTLPYDIEQRGKDVRIDLEKLPVPLKWVLWKFMKLPYP